MLIIINSIRNFACSKGGDEMNNRDNAHYELMKNGLLGSGIDMAKEYAEIALDSLLNEGILKEIPIVGTIFNLGKCGLTIKNLQFTRNYLTFLQEIRNNEKTVMELEKHIEELNNNPKQMEKEMETLLIYLEQYKSVDKIKYMANIYRAFLSPDILKIDWEETLIFFELLDRLLPCDIEDLKKMKTYGARATEFIDHSGLLRLSALGLLQYFNGKEEKYGHNKIGLARMTAQGKTFYSVITAEKAV